MSKSSKQSKSTSHPDKPNADDKSRDEVHELSQSERKDIFRELVDDIEISPSYAIQLTFASIIVILGLLIDSTAIVIGAMLIAPIFLPVLGVALGITSNKDQVLRKSVILLGGSIIGVFVMSYVITKITPIDTITSEIIARANPTILDLFIAFASAVIGILAYFDNKIASGSAGVAISLSLLPPLATSGIAAAFGDTGIMTRSMILFLANVGAIVFAGIVTLYLMNIRPRRYKKDQTRWKYGVAASIGFVLLISIPLTYYFVSSIQEANITRDIRTTLDRETEIIHPEAEIEDVTITFESTEESGRTAVVKARLLLPEQVFLTSDKQAELKSELTEQVQVPVRLKFNVLNTLLVRENIAETPAEALARQIRDEIQTRFDSRETPLQITSLDAVETDTGLQVDLLVRSSGSLPTLKDVEELESILESVFDRDSVTLNMSFIPISTIADQRPEVLIASDAETVLTRYLPFVSEDISVDEIRVTSSGDDTPYRAEVLLLTPADYQITSSQYDLLRQTLRRDVDARVDYEFKLLTYR